MTDKSTRLILFVQNNILILFQKASIELVNTKVDQTEFETAIEELGEAIGLLGLKFTRKVCKNIFDFQKF